MMRDTGPRRASCSRHFMCLDSPVSAAEGALRGRETAPSGFRLEPRAWRKGTEGSELCQ